MNLRRLAPPKQLGGRIRWLFVIFGVFNLVTVLPRVLGHGTGPVTARVAAAVAAVALAGWWLRQYRLGTFPAWMIPFEALALLAIGLGMRDWVATLGLLFVFVSFRGLYGTWRHVLTFTVLVFAAAVAGVALTEPSHVAQFLQQAPGVPPLALFTAAVAESTRRQERAAARERVFARLGSTLATTQDRETILRLSAEAAVELLDRIPGGWAVTVVDDLVVTAAGPVPVELLTGPVPPAAEGGGVRIPLRSDKQHFGDLLVGNGSAEVRPSLATLAAQTSLGLVNAEHAADLHYQAFHDNLTGLANRSLLREHLGHALARARRGSPVAVLLIDLDGFKQVNDTYGHAAGDQLLVAVAQRLRDGIRGADTAARLGGDEFAVVLDGMDAAGDAVNVAGRLLAAIQEPVPNAVLGATGTAGAALLPQASIGVAGWRGHAGIDELLHDADAAMYAAKTAGKGRVAHLDETGTVRLAAALTS
ncbi:diguanylate cyclase domain-containing protein [Dactylosporangium sp. CA-152071]|uniref:diguanylate cyclase domain-containing protein n=1 Tax=Dactylosporangium sp. CA-152071 TaxID=3239933 RepID=UPI003D90C5D9